MRRVLALALVLLAALGVACTTDADAGVGTPGPAAPSLDPSALPAATLHTAAGDVPGEPGTRCWANACVDMIGPITAPQLSAVAPGETLAIDFEQGSPSELVFAWMAAIDPPPTPVTSGVIAWSGLFPPISDAVASGLAAPTEPGRYILIASAFWHGEGDISYGFYLQVE